MENCQQPRSCPLPIFPLVVDIVTPRYWRKWWIWWSVPFETMIVAVGTFYFFRWTSMHSQWLHLAGWRVWPDSCWAASSWPVPSGMASSPGGAQSPSSAAGKGRGAPGAGTGRMVTSSQLSTGRGGISCSATVYLILLFLPSLLLPGNPDAFSPDHRFPGESWRVGWSLFVPWGWNRFC